MKTYQQIMGVNCDDQQVETRPKPLTLFFFNSCKEIEINFGSCEPPKA